jgi:hypothetical protein
MAVLLVICLSGMAVHFYVESLDTSVLPAVSVLNECTGHCEDHFIPFVNPVFHLDERLAVLTPELSLPQTSFDIPPLLPPPNS